MGEEILIANEKTLVLGIDPADYFVPWAHNRHIVFSVPALAFWFRNRNLPRRLQSRLGLTNPADLQQHYLQKALRRYDKIIFLNWTPACFLTNPLLAQPHRAKTYVFFWDMNVKNPTPAVLERIATLKRLHTGGVYSFQREDCETYGLHFNDTMYAPPPPALRAARPTQWDVFFCGVSKDRLPLLQEVCDVCQAAGLSSKFYIRKWNYGVYSTEGIALEQRPGWEVTEDAVSYQQYLDWLTQSRAVLDIYQTGQTGFSLRVMEHMFFEKKLITNNRVIKNAPFYHRENIFCWGEDNPACLREWLELPFVPIDEKIKNDYHYENWVKRFT